MPVLFSRACEYAIRVLSVMASQTDRKTWQIRKLAKNTTTPEAFLSKIFQILAKAGILNSRKGRGGGYSFARPANQIFLADIIFAIDGDSLFEACVLGLPECGEASPCPFHEEWGAMRESVVAALSQKSLADLAGTYNSGDK